MASKSHPSENLPAKQTVLKIYKPVLMTIVFDFIIFFILILSGYWIAVIVRSFFYYKDDAEQSKTKIARLTILSALAIIFLIAFWGGFIEPRLITVKKVDVSLDETQRKGCL
ncbi:hypothetical protein HZB94_01620 [Candidatus Falkowbacteria bacterium]|nr:hypothetical protein [Candidatus Falkowbacteria bacterium]